MSRSTFRRWRLIVPLVALTALACAAAALAASSHRAAGSTFVVDNSFTLKTSDPQRAFDPTGSIVDRGIYDTLFTYNKGDLATPVPLLVASWHASNGAKAFTFNLKQNVHFANGDPLTSADVVFSLNRLINLKGNPSFLLTGIVIKPKGKYTVGVCRNICCMLRGADEVIAHTRQKLGVGHKGTTDDQMFTFEEVECIGACSWGPAMQVGYDFHEELTPEKVDGILQEYANRTGQHGAPSLARDYQPALGELAAMPTRIEKWRVGGKICYRILGIQWGSPAPACRRMGSPCPRPRCPPTGASTPPTFVVSVSHIADQRTVGLNDSETQPTVTTMTVVAIV